MVDSNLTKVFRSKLPTILIALVISVIFSTSAFAQIPNYPECHGASIGTIQTKECLDKIYNQEDKKLNKTYRELKAKLDNAGKEKLGTAQTFWVKFKEANARFHSDVFYQGTIQGVVFYYRVIHLTQIREQELARYPDKITAESLSEGIAEAKTCLAEKEINVWNQCVKKVYEKADKKLNVSWKKAKKIHLEKFDFDEEYLKESEENRIRYIKKNMMDAENNWIQFRDANAEWIADIKRGKSEAGTLQILTKIRMTLDRAKELHQFRKDLE